MQKDLITDRIVFRGREIAERLESDLRALGFKRLRCPLTTLQKLSLESQKSEIRERSAYLRIEDFLRTSLGRTREDNPWQRGFICEGLIGGLMGGKVVGGEGQKWDILKGQKKISLKTYGGKEIRIQGGNLPRHISEHTTMKRYFAVWKNLFTSFDPKSENFIPLLEPGVGKPRRRYIRGESAMADLKLMSESSPRARRNYEEHRRRLKTWKGILRKCFAGLDYWLVIYIYDDPKTGIRIEMNWFTNEQVLDFLSPRNSLPPISFAGSDRAAFRFNANRLKILESVAQTPFKSGTFLLSDLVRPGREQKSRLLIKRGRVKNLIDSASEKDLDTFLQFFEQA